jgi:hypothetical protein
LEIGAGQVGIRQLGANQVGVAQVRIVQLRVGEVRPDQIVVAQISVLQIGPAKVRIAQVTWWSRTNLSARSRDDMSSRWLSKVTCRCWSRAWVWLACCCELNCYTDHTRLIAATSIDNGVAQNWLAHMYHRHRVRAMTTKRLVCGR